MSRSTLICARAAAIATAVVFLLAADGWAQRGGGGRGGSGAGNNRGGSGGNGGYGGNGGAYGFTAPGFGFYGSGTAALYGSNSSGTTSPYYLTYGGGNDSVFTPLYASGASPNPPAFNNASNSPPTTNQSNYPPDVVNGGRVGNNTASIEVQVPADAKVWFDGRPTSQTGRDRFFVSPPLEPGRTFTYEVKAMWIDASGKVMNQTRTVQVQGNRSSLLVFTTER
jgi:uncharacterized protein (TIGR03000 family)